jgi:hypothetical protein
MILSSAIIFDFFLKKIEYLFKFVLECLLKCETFNVEVEPGEIIIFDSDTWFHSTRIIGTDLSITIGSEYD